MRCLGLDLGSSSIKGAVLDLERRELGAVAREDFPPPLRGLPPGHFEVEPHLVEAAVARVLDALLQAEPQATALYCCGQMGGTILVDGSGAPLTNYLSWRDQRALARGPDGNSLLDSVRQRWEAPLLATLGNELQAGSTSVLLHWLAEQRQLPARATPASITDYAVGRLCGSPPQMHATQAIGLLDLGTGGWHTAALAALGLQQLAWPRQADLRQPVGYFRHGGRSLACYAAVGDQQCALYGAGLRRDELSLNISTGSQVSRRSAEFAPGPYQTRQHLAGDYLQTITHLPAGRSLHVLVELLSELARAEGLTLRQPWTTIAQRAAECGPSGLDVDLAFFAGPLGSSGRIGGITTENLTVGHLFAAAFQSMADNYSQCAARLWPDRAWRGLVLTGGLTQSLPALREMIQARFKSPLREPKVAEETLFGLLVIAREFP